MIRLLYLRKKTQNEDQPKIEIKEEINEDYVEIASKNRNKIESPSFIFAGGLELLNEVENNIYFLDRYYSKKYIEFNQNDAKAKMKHDAFIEGVKNSQYYKYKDFLKLHIYIAVFLRLFKGEWVICTAPGHNKSENMFNGVYNILNKDVWLNKRFTLVAGLLQRRFSVQKRALVKDRSSYFDEDIKTIIISSSFDIKDKNVVVFDDITTSGGTLLACKKVLLQAGAKNVVLCALGKTVSLL